MLLLSILKEAKNCQGQRRHTFMYKMYIRRLMTHAFYDPEVGVDVAGLLALSFCAI